MANDFKRMWTKEELKDTYYLPRYIENETITIDEKTFNSIKKHSTIAIYDDIQSWVYYHLTSSTICNKNNVETHIFIADTNVLRVDKENNEYTIRQIISEYININHFEDLVRATPTDVSIIEDQGKLELMLEHDGNVLAINDTPNQFLQRRLDKPSAKWNKGTSPTDLKTWLEEKMSSMYRGMVVYEDDEDVNQTLWGVVDNASHNNVTIKPYSIYRANDKVIYTIAFNLITETIIFELIDGTSYNISFNDVTTFWLY